MPNELQRTIDAVAGQLTQLTGLVDRLLTELGEVRERLAKIEEAAKIRGEYAREEKHDVKARLEDGDGAFDNLKGRVAALEHSQALSSGIWGKVLVAALSFGVSLSVALVAWWLRGGK
jgi:hypothetical protein